MKPEYNENQIQILEGLEAVRKRPGMYIGSTSSRGLHHLVYEIVDNAVDEALAGHCSEIEVSINKENSIRVKDNGRGIPIGIHPQKGIPAVEVVFTILHAGGKFGGGGYKVSGGLHGVGASVVNALSQWLVVKIYNGGKIYEQKYSRGDVVTKLTVVGECDKSITGTEIEFKPDYEIFDELEYSYDTLKQRLQETAFLTKGIKIVLKDLRQEEIKEKTFHYEGGIKEFVQHINKNKVPVYEDVFYCEGIKDNIFVEVAFQHNDGYLENNYSYVNNINTVDGGTHIAGFRSAITKTVNDYGKKFGLLKENEKVTGDDIREGLTSVVSIKIEEPQFEGQTKGKLGSKEAKNAVDSVLSENLTYFLEENPTIGKMIIEKALVASRARDAAKKARELVRRKSALEVGRLPGKLTDCSEKDPSKCELYIVEGNSAGGSAVNARTPKTQAILPLRGKILNVEKSRLDKILGNEEIRSMITAFGTGIHDDFDIEKLRYHKIVLMTDADVDGAHITTLLLTFIFRFMTPLIENGYVYLAKPPLYKIEKGKKEYYAYSDAERDEILQQIGTEGIKPIQRYKGLGEMDAEQLWETTMDPEKRILLRVTLEDARLADEIFDQLMGDRVEPRREFIQENAKFVTNLDV
ncbi:DNA topoisomerase (ATP-hydrolyzing) subunit B [uncultured Tyzzerella sp.]|uniref:DNA topoisomerase (ATP-hydrolyzing) subunit B n=1 Tax=uncultured Tyzzerella sp. TaxID=2321398 RepID=UPI002942794B|nr:DNA topoisomerase (ATP-hydrolyzing) subunit B [uncultured Tyzzerella sp.]